LRTGKKRRKTGDRRPHNLRPALSLTWEKKIIFECGQARHYVYFIPVSPYPHTLRAHMSVSLPSRTSCSPVWVLREGVRQDVPRCCARTFGRGLRTGTSYPSGREAKPKLQNAKLGKHRKNISKGRYAARMWAATGGSPYIAVPLPSRLIGSHVWALRSPPGCCARRGILNSGRQLLALRLRKLEGLDLDLCIFFSIIEVSLLTSCQKPFSSMILEEK